jgi:pyochelin biosynthesis protein PchC
VDRRLPRRRAPQAIANYRYTSGRPLRCPVTALAGDRDPLVPAAQAAAWERHRGAAFRLRVFAGGHFFLRRQVAAITQLIGDHIAAALRRRP